MAYFVKNIAFLLILIVGMLSCQKEERTPSPPAKGSLQLFTDKARYSPGEQVTFTTNIELPGSAIVRYKFLGEEISVDNISGKTWLWTAPSDDFKGYLAEIYSVESESETILATIAIDVSSDWTKFPRYGFLSDYGDLTESHMESVIQNLNRHHINGLQYYDWQFKHHMPLAGTPENPTAVYKDIINKDVYFSTLQNYIELSHKYNMKSMFYNLAFGVLNDASYDGVAEEWYIFFDKNHSNKDLHSLPKPPFKSDIFLVNPDNSEWQNYLNSRNSDVYAALDFDGFHIDQLGNRGTRYDYWGNQINLPRGYTSFISATKSTTNNKYHVMNAVNQYGQVQIAASAVDFLYTEVWSPNESYSDLAQIIQYNNSLGNAQKNTVLAAYMNYNQADNKGYFNTPAVLFTNAVIFAFGGSHLELGEHMLGKEYFPNNNLDMKADLQNALIIYYDFLVAYQNILRDGGAFNNPLINSSDGRTVLNQWPPASGTVSVIGKELTDKQIIHLINFSGATHFDWRDNASNQSNPTTYYDCSYTLTTDKQPKKVWFVSPDYKGGASVEIPYQIDGSKIIFTLPTLTYWDIIVVEY